MPEPTSPLSRTAHDLDDDPATLARRLQVEIEAEAERRRRRDPEIARHERELERAWAAVSPPGADGDPDAVLLDRLDRLALVDVDVPVGSRPGIRQVKAFLRKLLYWYLRHLADQVNAFTGVVTRFAHRVDARLRALEEALDLEHLDELVDLPEPSSAVAGAVTARVDVGPVAVCTCGRGSLVAAFDPALVAHGVDPRPERLVEASRAGHDVRPADPVEHLRGLAPGSVRTVVLTGVIEQLPLGPARRLLDLARRAVGDGGRLVVVATDPARRDTVTRDLLAGRGLAPETWAHLARRAGDAVELVDTGDPVFERLVVVDVGAGSGAAV